jgi:NlpC/P60 family protein
VLALRQDGAKRNLLSQTGSMKRQFHFVMFGITVFSLLLLQQASAAGKYAAGLRPLSVREGLSIVRETSFVEISEGRTEDCSHLVHDLYEQAGYPYPYANSRELYLGTENFVRVRAPHPGDLVVWRGHVGIVLDPQDHSFFSSVNSGPKTEYYDSAYWHARGIPRFYRYLTKGPSKAAAVVTETASRNPEQGPSTSGTTGRAVRYGPTLEAVKTAPTKIPAATAQSEDAVESGAKAVAATQIVLHIAGKQPTAADIVEGLAAANRGVGEILRTGNLEKLAQPMTIYQDLRVTDVSIKGKRGSARVEVDCVARLAGGQMDSRRNGEQFGLELQRTKKDWVMNPSAENTYVPREAAMRVLAARLAALTQREDANAAKESEQAQIIRLLSLLVEEN